MERSARASLANFMNTKKVKSPVKSIIAIALALILSLSCAYLLPVDLKTSAATSQATTSAKQVKITGSSVNVRKGAGTSYGVITSVKRGNIYTYTATQKVSSVTWYKIVYSGTKTGWISGSYATVVKTATTTVTTTTTAVPTTTTTTTTTSPTTIATSVSTTETETTTTTPTESSTTESTTTTTQKSTTTTTTTTTTASVQDESPHKKMTGAQAYAITLEYDNINYYDCCCLYKYVSKYKCLSCIDYLDSNEKYPILGTYTSDDGTEYYAIKYTDGTVRYIEKDSCLKVYNGTKKYVNASTLNMRNKASTKGSVVKKLSRNAVVYVQNTSNGWSKVVSNGTTGYVMSKYLSSNAVKSYGFKTKGSVSSSRQKYANKYMSYIPTKIWNRFIDKGWTLRITTEDIKKVYAPNHSVSGTFAGLTIYGDNMIVVGYSEKRIRRALLHEMGHFVDAELGYISLGDEFKAIYTAEKNKANFKDQVDKHCVSSSHEYFAEAFNQYLQYPSNLKKNAPKTYAFIKKCIANF